MKNKYDYYGKNVSRMLSVYRPKLYYSSNRECYYCGGPSPWSIYCSDECAIQYMKEAMEDDPIAIGFIPRWYPLRRLEVLQRDEYTCQDCGSCEYPEVHHIIPIGCGGDNELTNLVTLCNDCHKNYTRFWSRIRPRYGDEIAPFENWIEGFKLMQKRFGRLLILS